MSSQERKVSLKDLLVQNHVPGRLLCHTTHLPCLSFQSLSCLLKIDVRPIMMRATLLTF